MGQSAKGTYLSRYECTDAADRLLARCQSRVNVMEQAPSGVQWQWCTVVHVRKCAKHESAEGIFVSVNFF